MLYLLSPDCLYIGRVSTTPVNCGNIRQFCKLQKKFYDEPFSEAICFACVCPCLRLCVRDCMFSWYLQYLLIDFRQTFVICASWDKDELIRFWGSKVTLSRWRRPTLYAAIDFTFLVSLLYRFSFHTCARLVVTLATLWWHLMRIRIETHTVQLLPHLNLPHRPQLLSECSSLNTCSSKVSWNLSGWKISPVNPLGNLLSGICRHPAVHVSIASLVRRLPAQR